MTCTQYPSSCEKHVQMKAWINAGNPLSIRLECLFTIHSCKTPQAMWPYSGYRKPCHILMVITPTSGLECFLVFFIFLFEACIKLIFLFTCWLCMVLVCGRKPMRKPMQTRGEHANSTQKNPRSKPVIKSRIFLMWGISDNHWHIKLPWMCVKNN